MSKHKKKNLVSTTTLAALILGVTSVGIIPLVSSASSPIACTAPAGNGAVARTVQNGTVCEIRFTASGSPGTNTWAYTVPAGVTRVSALLIGAGGNSYLSSDGEAAAAGGGGEVFFASNLFSLGGSSSRQFDIKVGYADTVETGLTLKADVVVASQTDIDLSAGGLLTIDGVTLATGNLVLVKDQSLTFQNGIYVASAGSWMRWTGYDAVNEMAVGDLVRITGGSQYSIWRQTATVTDGTSPILWEQNWEFSDGETEITRAGGNHYDAMAGSSSGSVGGLILGGQSGDGEAGGTGPIVSGSFSIATGGGRLGEGLYAVNPSTNISGGAGRSAETAATPRDRHLWSDLSGIFSAGGSYFHSITSSPIPTQGLGTGGSIGRDVTNPSSPLLVGGFGSNGTAIIRFFTSATPTVTFMANGGTGTMTAQASGSDVALAPNAFQREGYTFVGWNSDPLGNDNSFGWSDGATYQFSTLGSDLLYAQWIPVGSFLFNNGHHKRGNSTVQAARTQPLFQPGSSSIEIGNDMLVNDYVDFYDVATVTIGGAPVSVGVRITFLDHFGSTGDGFTADELDKLDGAADMDESENNYLLKSEIDFDTSLDSEDSFVEVNIAFFRDLSASNFLTSNPPTPVSLTNLELNLYDLDASQFIGVEGSYRPFISSNSLVDIENPSERFPYRTFVGPDTSTSDEESFTIGRARLVFSSVQEFNIRMGVLKEAIAGAQSSEIGATYLLDFGPGLPWGDSNESPIEFSSATPASAPFTGPIPMNRSTIPAETSTEATLTGERLNLITGATVNGKPVTLKPISATTKGLVFPALPAGTYDVIFTYQGGGTITQQSGLRVTPSSAVAAPQPGQFTAQRLFANYRGDRGPVIARDRAAITTFIRQYSGITTVRCVGSTSGVPAKRTDPALAQARAKNACDIVKRLVPNATISLETSTGKGIGQRFRSVTIFISGTN